jgi:stringent starvation protein B
MVLSMGSKMTPLKPYLIRATYEWILDNGFTPYVIVRVTEGINVPERYISDGLVVLNLAPTAVRDFSLTNESISFSARFAGTSYDIYIPIEMIAEIFARENRLGMVFDDLPKKDDALVSAETSSGVDVAQKSKAKTHLSIVK